MTDLRITQSLPHAEESQGGAPSSTTSFMEARAPKYETIDIEVDQLVGRDRKTGEVLTLHRGNRGGQSMIHRFKTGTSTIAESQEIQTPQVTIRASQEHHGSPTDQGAAALMRKSQRSERVREELIARGRVRRTLLGTKDPEAEIDRFVLGFFTDPEIASKISQIIAEEDESAEHDGD